MYEREKEKKKKQGQTLIPKSLWDVVISGQNLEVHGRAVPSLLRVNRVKRYGQPYSIGEHGRPT